ncbi:MAG: hypothetical protein ACNS60_15725 [Candidatus Cyclobacteriaceae bacterium M2_1C_046]
MAGKENKGNPSGQGQSKGDKEEKAKGTLDREREEVYQERYTDEEGEEPADNVRQNNPNRNPEKGQRE